MWKKTLVGCSMLVLSAVAFAIPSEQQVEAAVKQGQYQEAETMMSEVVAARPQSAKAHYIYAELLARNGRFAQASTEAAKAKEIDPQIRFTDPAKFNAFVATLTREQSAPARSRTTTGSSSSLSPSSMATAPAPATAPESRGIPGWVWLAGLLVLAVVLWRGFARSRAASSAPMAGGPGGMASTYGPAGPAGGPMGGAGYGPANGPGYGPANGPGYGPGGAPMQRSGGGLLGTGLALGAGVAGGMLLDRALHSGHDGSGAIDPASAGAAGGMAGLGGLDPDSYNPGADGAARELENRPIDFGSGNDWDSGGGGDGGVDLGSGGGGDDWA